jgi:hypothetical protein
MSITRSSVRHSRDSGNPASLSGFASFADLHALRVKQRPSFHAKSAKKKMEEREDRLDARFRADCAERLI